ncbi:MAG: N-acetylmuramoyl-L-alanine amidase [Elusimicrobia bacterium]|nr:N-acetylmuramoyl-L-alanine amidase [Elusimicrobiota bacterium]
MWLVLLTFHFSLLTFSWAAPAKPQRIPFMAQVSPKKEQINFWAYRHNSGIFIPTGSLGQILKAKTHRYKQSRSVVLVLGPAIKRLEATAGQKAIVLGKQPLALNHAITLTPDQKDLLIPMDVLDAKPFQDYTGFEFNLEEEGKIAAWAIQTIEPPDIEPSLSGAVIEFKLPDVSPKYEITYHPAGHPSQTIQNAKTGKKTLPKKAGAPACLEVRFPYAKLSEKTKKTPAHAGPSLASWTVSRDPVENSAVFHFPLAPAVSFGDIDAKETAWPFKKLKIIIPQEKAAPPALAVAKRTQKALQSKLRGADIYLTRKKDNTLSLTGRTVFARNKNPHIFVSIHANTSQTKNKGGFEIYIPTYVSSEAARAKARAAAGPAKKRLDRSALLPEKLVLRQSEKLAWTIHNSLENRLDGKIQGRGILKGDFHVLRETGVPAVLIEIGFLTHKNDASYLVNPGFQEICAKAIAQGIVNFLKSL